MSIVNFENDLLWVFNIFGRESLAVHVHSVLLAVIDVDLGRPIGSNRRSIAQDTVVVVVPLVDRLVSLARIAGPLVIGIIINIGGDILNILLAH